MVASAYVFSAAITPRAPSAVAPIPASTSRLFTAKGLIVDQSSREPYLRMRAFAARRPSRHATLSPRLRV